MCLTDGIEVLHEAKQAKDYEHIFRGRWIRTASQAQHCLLHDKASFESSQRQNQIKGMTTEKRSRLERKIQGRTTLCGAILFPWNANQIRVSNCDSVSIQDFRQRSGFQCMQGCMPGLWFLIGMFNAKKNFRPMPVRVFTLWVLTDKE